MLPLYKKKIIYFLFHKILETLYWFQYTINTVHQVKRFIFAPFTSKLDDKAENIEVKSAEKRLVSLFKMIS